MPDKSFAKPNREVIETGRKFAAIFRPAFDKLDTTIRAFCKELDLSRITQITHWLQGKIQLPDYRPPLKHHVATMTELLPLGSSERRFRTTADKWEDAYLKQYSHDKYTLKQNRKIYDLCQDEDDSAKQVVALKIRSLIKETFSKTITDKSAGKLIRETLVICGYTNAEFSLVSGISRSSLAAIINRGMRLGLEESGGRRNRARRIAQHLCLESISPGLEQEFLNAITEIYNNIDNNDINHTFDTEMAKKSSNPLRTIVKNLLVASHKGEKREYNLLREYDPDDLSLCSYLKRLEITQDRKNDLRTIGFRNRGSGKTPQEIMEEFHNNRHKKAAGLLEKLKETYGHSVIFIMEGLPINPSVSSVEHQNKVRRELFRRFNSLDMVPTKEDMEIISSNIFCNEPPETQKKFSRILAIAYDAKDEEPDLDIRNNSLVKQRERCNFLESIKTERRLSTHRVYTIL